MAGSRVNYKPLLQEDGYGRMRGENEKRIKQFKIPLSGEGVSVCLGLTVVIIPTNRSIVNSFSTKIAQFSQL
ncbi:hypothetical protein FACS1894217_08690 [Clostridia bacterium]|nr:hypothetical protein FACS1894217_08690 [Clostridia bacterium]